MLFPLLISVIIIVFFLGGGAHWGYTRYVRWWRQRQFSRALHRDDNAGQSPPLTPHTQLQREWRSIPKEELVDSEEDTQLMDRTEQQTLKVATPSPLPTLQRSLSLKVSKAIAPVPLMRTKSVKVRRTREQILLEEARAHAASTPDKPRKTRNQNPYRDCKHCARYP